MADADKDADKDEILQYIERDAEASGYFPCPEEELLVDLIDGLAMNIERYGYGACPCRIASGIKTYDSDIICPCEYRDIDIEEFGMCYCGLYVSEAIFNDPSKLGQIPERRPPEAQDAAMEAKERLEEEERGSGDRGGRPEAPSPASEGDASKGSMFGGDEQEEITVWRCTVCGYLCARELPPPICPICKAKADRFEAFGVT